MFARYQEVWNKYFLKYGPKTALLYQVGGFFELYDIENLTTGVSSSNVRQIAEICQLSLTEHRLTNDEQTLFGGFPEYSVDKFEKILVANGFTVVVVTQKKNSAGDVEERVVEHISSPGCYVENGPGSGFGSGSGSGSADRYLVGVTLESATEGSSAAALRQAQWSAVSLDLATGRIRFAEGSDRDRLHQFLCLHPPAEIVVWADGGAGAADITDALRSFSSQTDALRSFSSQTAAAVHIQCKRATNAAIEVATLEQWWTGARQRLDWMSRMPASRQTLATLMEFAADHIPSSLVALEHPEPWIPVDEVRLGNAALEQLGVLSLHATSEKRSLLSMLSSARSVGGRRLLRARLVRPICNIPELTRRLDLMEQCSQRLGNTAIERGLRSLYDMARLWRRMTLGTAYIGDLACLLRSWQAAESLQSAMCLSQATSDTVTKTIASEWNIDILTSLAREGITIPVADLPMKAAVLSADAALFTAFSSGVSIRKQAQALCDAWSAMAGGSLCLVDAEGGGFRITGTKRRINAAWTQLRDSDNDTATVTQYKNTSSLETAELNALSARHRIWMSDWNTTWKSAWQARIRDIVQRAAAAHAALETWCSELDVAWLSACIAKEWLWRRPEFVEPNENGSWVYTETLRHPILDRILATGVPYVPHNLTLDAESSGLLLYGMNASGKSSLMKSVGLSVLLAQAGFPVPASVFRLAPFRSVFTRILGNDDLWAGLSSFAVEMTEFREVLRFADKHTLVLGDELCSGTESLSATALVAAGIETLSQRGTKFVFATHLHQLATLPDIMALSHVKTAHLRVHYDAATDTLVYDRSLAPGSGSALYGLEVCKALDLPTKFLDRAMALRKELDGWQAPRTSAYSNVAAVIACEVCRGRDGLETHHILEQRHAKAAAGAGIHVHSPGNLVTLCTGCHDDHHAGRLRIEGWQELAGGMRRLVWVRGDTVPIQQTQAQTKDTAASDDTHAEITGWVREQKRQRIKIPVIRRMATQLFGVELTEAFLRAVKI
jgi:DNA mismatch repair protein MutS